MPLRLELSISWKHKRNTGVHPEALWTSLRGTRKTSSSQRLRRRFSYDAAAGERTAVCCRQRVSNWYSLRRGSRSGPSPGNHSFAPCWRRPSRGSHQKRSCRGKLNCSTTWVTLVSRLVDVQDVRGWTLLQGRFCSAASLAGRNLDLDEGLIG